MKPTTQKPIRIGLCIALLAFSLSQLHSQAFVRADATGANNGTSWADAFTSLSTALNSIVVGEVWVAAGTYTPTDCSPCDETDRQVAFRIPPGIRVYGGFAGNELGLSQRDFQANPTVLSGDIGLVGDSTDNSYNVVIAENATASTVLDGFTITEGNADGSFGFSAGGGLLLDANSAGTANIRVSNCTFLENYGGGGGGVAIDCVLGGLSQALFRNCVFQGNTASLEVVSTGAAVFMQGNSGAQVLPRFVSCTFRNNYSGNDGGAIAATPTGIGGLLALEVDSCYFANNQADDRGAAIWYRTSSDCASQVMIRNSRFINNRSGGQGGAVFARSSFGSVANDTLLNCLFSQNRTDGSSTINDGEGGAVFLRASQDGTRSHYLLNCVFDRNFASERGGGVATTSFVFGAGTCNAFLTNCSFYGNSAAAEGGGIHVEGAEGVNTMTIRNSILWRDSTAASGSEVATNGGAVSVAYSNINGGVPSGVIDAGNNLTLEPEFAGPATGDLHLLACSPLIDAGDNSVVLPVADPDPDGDPRIFNGVVDLGAYERGIVYVDKMAAGANTGKSWADAYVDLQTGLDAAQAGDQLWVAESTYFPVACSPCTEDDRQAAFHLKNGVEIYGGFAGVETALAQRDWADHPTILSGDIGIPGDSTDNTYRVAIAENIGPKTLLDGLIIEEGNADGSFGLSAGGGLLMDANPAGVADMQVRNCTFRNNYAGGGGGVAIDCVLGGRSNALFRNCRFEGNTASLGVVSTGAGVFMQGNSGAQVTPRFVHCTFQDNYCGNDGGAISATPTGLGTLLAFKVDSCLFTGNRADDRGAGIWYQHSSDALSRVVIKNSQFLANRAGGQGGAIFARSSFDAIASDTLANCAFIGNQTDGASTINDGEGGAVFLRGSQNGTRNHLIVNCLFAENSASERGGAIGTTSTFFSPGTLTVAIINCTFFANSTPGSGGAIHAEGSEGQHTVNVFNSILWSNAAGGISDAIFSNGADVSLAYCDMQGQIPAGISDGGNNFSADPQWLDPEGEDFRISACSPARNAGLNSALPPDLPDIDSDGDITEAISIDLGGANRIFEDTIDLGAYEWNEDPPALNLEITTTDVSCNGLSDGQAVVAATGGVPGYTYAWSDGQTTATATGLSAGTYYLTVSDDFNCVRTDSVQIEEGEPLLLEVSNDTVVCAGETVMLSAAATGGDGNYTFDWNENLENGNTQTINPVATTSYIVTITDGNACTAEDSITVAVNELPEPTVGDNISLCAGDSTELSAGAFAAYEWSTGATSPGITVSEAGAYSVTVMDGAGCTGSDTVGVAVNANPEAEITGSLTFCPGGTTELSAPPGLSAYLWSDGTEVPTLEVSTPGTYSLTVTDENGCAGSAEALVSESANLEPAIAGELAFCAGDSTELSAGAFAAYEWSTGATSPGITVSEAGAYSVTVMDGAGCTGSDTVGVAVNANPEAEITGSLTFCPGGTTELSAPPGLSAYLWSDGTEVPTLEVSTPGTYSLTVTDENGCAGSAEALVSESANLEPAIAGELAFCAGDSTELSAGAFAAYEWSTGATSPGITVSEAGAYSVTVMDGAGCTGSDTVGVAVNANPEAEITGSLTFCPGGTTELSAPPGLSAYLWSDGTEVPTLEVSTPGTYSLTVTDENGCAGSAEALVSESANLEPAIAGELAFCAGDSTELSAGAFAAYEWSTGATSPGITVSEAGAYSVTVMDGAGCTGSDTVGVAVNANPEAEITGSLTFCPGGTTELSAPPGLSAYLWSDGTEVPTLEVSTPGTYSLTVTDENGCAGSAEALVSESANLEPAIAGELAFCAGDSTELSAGAFAAYEWSTGATSPGITVSEAGAYSVTVVDGDGCTGEATVAVSAIEPPLARDDQFTMGVDEARIAIYDLVNNDGISGGGWTLTIQSGPGLGTIEALEEGLLIYRADALAAGEARIVYELCSRDCPDLCTQAIVIINVASAVSTEELPNGITPNGDGLNDTFVFDLLLNQPAGAFPDNRLVIFNRWGDIVYERRDYDNSWDGRNRDGSRLPDGTYYYVLYLDISSGLILKGDITLLR